MASVMLTLMVMAMALPITGEAESPTATGLPKDWGLTMASVMPMLMVMAMATALLVIGEVESPTAIDLLKDLVPILVKW